jgi:hypothetical protein
VSRRAAAGAAAALLLALELATQDWAELPRRVRFVRAFAPKELAVRRLGGSGTAFNRRYFSFLENARRRIPPGTVAVVLEPEPSDVHRYLGAYSFAPVPVYVGPFPNRWTLPERWVIASYGPQPASDVGVIARLPEGVLLGPRQR